MARDGFEANAVSQSDPQNLSKLQAKNCLDKGVHFIFAVIRSERRRITKSTMITKPRLQNDSGTNINKVNVTCEYCNKSKGKGTAPKNPKYPDRQ